MFDRNAAIKPLPIENTNSDPGHHSAFLAKRSLFIRVMDGGEAGISMEFDRVMGEELYDRIKAKRLDDRAHIPEIKRTKYDGVEE